ncbi:hypothetical protein GCM10011613_33330 [Cellvibrio zantedeschiae]|uniref:PA14 domain-containing protein n=1 Tax=Cellvibrio zantedeschiae TaxID=1237077 RepID=A0ABQ3B948_9GAMM|nr:PA14 domain-containing protein [Cellvibrio zantedeschiae]GGY85737.1 hypothetical protein GCM10011613_33330 [Cellvibrio zantedeschiae]
MTTIPFNRNIVFSVMLAIIAVAIIYRITPPYVSGVFDLVISKNRITITDIHQPRDIEMTKTVKVDRIDLADKSRFRHPKLGDIGYAGDFWVDINAPFTVKKAGDYVFYLGSDDGFIFSIDGQQLCEWTHDRPLTVNACQIRLMEGEHKFKLVYFQGYGNAGLTMGYSYGNNGVQYIAGENSRYISF